MLALVKEGRRLRRTLVPLLSSCTKKEATLEGPRRLSLSSFLLPARVPHSLMSPALKTEPPASLLHAYTARRALCCFFFQSKVGCVRVSVLRGCFSFFFCTVGDVLSFSYRRTEFVLIAFLQSVLLTVPWALALHRADDPLPNLTCSVSMRSVSDRDDSRVVSVLLHCTRVSSKRIINGRNSNLREVETSGMICFRATLALVPKVRGSAVSACDRPRGGGQGEEALALPSGVPEPW